MLTAEAQIETERPSRYLVQLCKHANQMGQRSGHRARTHGGGDTPPQVRHVEWSDTHGVVKLNLGQWTIQATSDTLILRAEADDEQNLRRIQALLARRIETIGRRDNLKVHWQATTVQPGEPTTEPTPTGKTTARRGHRNTILLIAAGVLAIAIHVGLGGVVLASMSWTGWTADVILAVVLAKVVTVVVIGLRRRSVRRNKAAMPAGGRESDG
jgi:hypothetical protein